MRKDVSLAILVLNKMPDIREKEESLLKSILERVRDADSAITLSIIVRDIRRIAGYAVAIADDAMNRVLVPTTH